MPEAISKSVRIPRGILRELDELRGDESFSDVVNRALRRWIKAERRRQDAQRIVEALRSRSPERVAEENDLARLAEESAIRVLGDEAHGD